MIHLLGPKTRTKPHWLMEMKNRRLAQSDGRPHRVTTSNECGPYIAKLVFFYLPADTASSGGYAIWYQVANCTNMLLVFSDTNYDRSAKYPLSVVNKVLDVFPARPGLGYDIGCSFTQTVMRSSIAEKAKEKQLHLVIPSFHGYAHKHVCQLSYHPLYVSGFRIEDLETAERIFSSFNGLANTTRYATRFHRHQAIDLYARQHDDDKYQELCAFQGPFCYFQADLLLSSGFPLWELQTSHSNSR
jgi:Kyakuja-Dileera-Zisupton transposase